MRRACRHRPDPRPRPDRAVPPLPDGGVRRLAEHAGGLPVGHRRGSSAGGRSTRPGRWRGSTSPTLAGYVDYLSRLGPGPEQRRPAPGQPLDVLPVPDLRRPADGERGQAAGRPGGLGPAADGARPAAVDRLLDAPDRDDAARPPRPGGAGDPVRDRLPGLGGRRPPARATSTSRRARPGASARGTRSGSSRSGSRAREAPARLSRARPARRWSRGGPRRRPSSSPRSGRPLSRVGLWRIVKTHARAAGLPEQRQPAHAPAQLRHPPARRRGRPPRRPGDARPRLDRHDPDLHPGRAQPAPRGPRPVPPPVLSRRRRRRRGRSPSRGPATSAGRAGGAGTAR